MCRSCQDKSKEPAGFQKVKKAWDFDAMSYPNERLVCVLSSGNASQSGDAPVVRCGGRVISQNLRSIVCVAYTYASSHMPMGFSPLRSRAPLIKRVIVLSMGTVVPSHVLRASRAAQSRSDRIGSARESLPADRVIWQIAERC